MSSNRTKKANQERVHAEHVTRVVAMLLLLVAISGLLVWEMHQWLMNPETLPIKIVRIDGELKYLQKNELENAVADKVSGGFFNIDLQQIKTAAQQLAWVDEVSVKRVWPDSLVMQIEEKVAIARWGEKRLVSAKGEIFLPPGSMPKDLAVMHGPDGRVAEVVRRYKSEQQRFAGQQLEMAELKVNERGAWSIRFANGLKIAVGRDNVEPRLERLARYLEAITGMKGMPKSIDLRYRHGMAVLWKPADEQENKDVHGEGAV